MPDEVRPPTRPTRRTLVRGAAWTIPTVATVSAAPAFALSPCTTRYTINMNDYAVGATSGFAAGGVSMSYTTNNNAAAGNGAIFQTTTTSRELRFYDPNVSGTSQTITLTFSAAVKNLSLTIIDVDRTATWDDRVTIGTGGFTFAFGAGSVLTGDGTAATPFRSTSTTSVPDGGTAGNVTVNWTASLTTVNFTYSQPVQTISGQPHIGLVNVGYNPVLC